MPMKIQRRGNQGYWPGDFELNGDVQHLWTLE